MMQGKPSLRPIETPWVLVAIAIGWLVLGFTCGGATSLLLLKSGALFPSVAPVSLYVVAWYAGIFVTDFVLFAAAMIQGRVVGSGNIKAGLGNEPVARLPLVACLAAVVIVYVIVRHSLPQTSLFRAATPPLPTNFFLASLLIVTECVIEPIAEESLFRGWLWTGLQRCWGTLPTALLTSVLFLTIHFRLQLMVILLPVTIILALVRHFGQSVRASVALHMIYNVALKSLLWLPQV